jgi:hypothetical protein
MKGPGKMFGGKFGGFKKQQNVDDLINEELDPSE